MKKLFALILAALMVLSMVACTNDSKPEQPDANSPATDTQQSAEPTETTDPEEKEDVAVKGGILKIATTGDISSMLAHKLRGGTDRAFGCVIFEKLFNFDSTGTPYPFLLESYEEDPVNLTYTLHVRKGIKFHDGSDLNADVVAWNLQLYKDQGVQSASFLGSVDKIEAIDEYTVVLTLSAWDSLIPVYMAREGGCGYIVSKQAWETYGEDYCKEHPVTTAPFQFVSWEHDTAVKLEKFADYWQGEPNLDGVEICVYNSMLVAQAAMESGEVHAMMNISDTEVVEYLGMLGFNVTLGGIPSSAHTIAFECIKEGDPFSDIRVRQAASYALDGSAIGSAIYGEYAKATTQYCLPGTPYYSEDVTGYPYNPEKAKELLAEAGYPNGFDTVIYVNSQSQIGIDVVTIVIEQLAQVGINAEIQLRDNAQYSQLVDGWDGGMLYHAGGIDSGAAAFVSGSYARDLTSGIGLKSFDKPDELYDVIAEGKAGDAETCQKCFQKAQYIIFEQECMLKCLYNVLPLAVTAPGLHDSDIGATGGTSSDLWDAWLEQ